VKLVLATITVVEGEPFTLPEGAVIVSTEPVFISMDGKRRRRITYTLPWPS
jgi:hypothetical protein